MTHCYKMMLVRFRSRRHAAFRSASPLHPGQALPRRLFLPVRSDVGSHPTTVRTCHPRSKRRHPHLAWPFVCIDDPLVKASLARYQEGAHARRAHAANRSGSRRAHEWDHQTEHRPGQINLRIYRADACRIPSCPVARRLSAPLLPVRPHVGADHAALGADHADQSRSTFPSSSGNRAMLMAIRRASLVSTFACPELLLDERCATDVRLFAIVETTTAQNSNVPPSP
jgi:hypothetical protein